MIIALILSYLSRSRTERLEDESEYEGMQSDYIGMTISAQSVSGGLPDQNNLIF